MNISAWSIRHPIPPIVLFLLLTLAGLVCFQSLGVDQYPNMDLPVVSVSIAQSGAAPSELENQVTRKVEDAVSGVAGVKHITSTVTEGSSSTTIEFELGLNADRCVNDVRDAVTRIRQQLPAQIQEPQVSRQDFTGGPLATYTISRPGSSQSELSWLIDDTISRELLMVKGVGRIQRSGGVDREIQVNLNPARLDAYRVTAERVNEQIRNQNIDLPGGRSTTGGQEESIRTLGSVTNLENLGEVRIATANQSSVPLRNLGTIVNGFREPRQRALLNGETVVAFQVLRSRGNNMVTVARRVDEALERLRQDSRLRGAVITKVRTTATYVLESYEASLEHLILGAALAVVVIYFFLRDWRAAAISALAMPLSVIPTFLVMKWANFTLNDMSLLALALVVGILVDDAIVEIENIVRHMQMGKAPYRAALEAADEIGLAVVATTASIMVVFLPVAFMPGISGQFFRQFGLTVAVAVFFSLVVARLLTPLLAAYFLSDEHYHTPEGKDWLVRLYDRTLALALTHRLPTILLAGLFFLFSMGLFVTLPTNLVGQVDRGEVVVSAEMAPGIQMGQATRVARRLTHILRQQSEVRQVFAAIGTPETAGEVSSGGTINQVTLYVGLNDKGSRKKTQAQFERFILPKLVAVPGVRLKFVSEEGLSGKLALVLSSNDGKQLERVGQAVLAEMRTMPGLYDLHTSAARPRPEILIRPNSKLASAQGVSASSIARLASVATMGDIDQNLAKFNLKSRQISIRVQLDPRFRNQIQTLRDLKLISSSGVEVPLSSVARIKVGEGPAQIDRFDRRRKVQLEASLGEGVSLGDALAQVRNSQAYRNKGPEVTEAASGDLEFQNEFFQGFALAIGAAIVSIYAVLVLLFAGFIQPLTIMVALPLSIGGAVVALIMTGEPLGMYALIGIVMLMGLTTKNSILLVEYVLTSMAAGTPREQAIFESGEARMRPILMTTVAMVAGMLPIALGIGAGAEARKSMAVAVIGGLTTSTLLTLIVVPVVFTYLDQVGVWLRRRFSRLADRGGSEN